jgi:hypothetical protein
LIDCVAAQGELISFDRPNIEEDGNGGRPSGENPPIRDRLPRDERLSHTKSLEDRSCMDRVR